jgi:hypothetical protein
MRLVLLEILFDPPERTEHLLEVFNRAVDKPVELLDLMLEGLPLRARDWR